MLFPFSKLTSSRIDGSVAVSKPHARESIHIIAYCQVIIFVFALAASGLYEEDVENKLVGLRRDARLLQCPTCDRQKVVVITARHTCRGHGIHRHKEAEMIPLGQGHPS